MKKVKNYFPHDFNAREDIKLKKVRKALGLEGIGLYWCLIEYLYENDGYLSLNEDIELISEDLHIELDKILKLIENYDLFKKNKNNFYSASVLKRLQEINDRSIKNRNNALKRWGKTTNCDDTNAMQPQCNSTTNAVQPQCNIKENKKKENKIKVVKDNLSLTTTTTNNVNTKIYEYVENNFARLITPIEKETIDKLLLEFDEDVFKYAITIAVLNRKTLFSYVVGILNNWKSQNLKSLKDVKDYEKKYYCENRSSINENDETQIIDEDILNYNWFEDNSHSNSFDNLDT